MTNISPHHRALRLLLRPLVRYALKNSLKIQDFIGVTKGVYLEVADEFLRTDRQKVNTSRLIAFTGIHRNEVEKIHFSPPSDELVSKPDLLTRIIHLWENDPRFLTKSGEPKILKQSGDQDEFKELVQAVGKYLHHSTVLFALEKLGKIEKTTRGLKLVPDRGIITHDYVTGMEIAGQDLQYLIQSVEENLSAAKPVHHHRRTSFDAIPRSRMHEVREWIRSEGAKFHDRIRKYLAGLDQGEGADRQNVQTVAVSSFSAETREN